MTDSTKSKLTHEGEERCYFCTGETIHSYEICGKWLDVCERCNKMLMHWSPTK